MSTLLSAVCFNQNNAFTQEFSNYILCHGRCLNNWFSFKKETKYFTFNQQCAGNNHEVGNQHNEIAKACKINSSRVHNDI